MPPKNDPIPSAKRRRQVALLIDFSRWYGRRILLGVAKFVREHHNWSVQCEEWRWTDPVPAWIKNWKGSGVIAWLETPELAEAIRKLNVPTVDVRGVSGCELPLINTENRLVSNFAAEHLIQRGFRNYAFCGFVGANYSDARSKWFQEHLTKFGFDCAIYQPPEISRNLQSIELEKRGLLFQEHLAFWLKSLPKPVGIMACNDIRGQQIMNACRRMDLLVPEEVAIIGADNDELFCELSDPPLSSVALDTLRIGYEAATLLERMLNGGKPPKQPVLIPPLGIVARRSTDVFAMSDRQLATGVRFLREHVFDAITVNDIARAAAMSRRAFEKRFFTQFGHAPKAEVLRLRLTRAKELLQDTDWTLAQIADRTGFKHGEYLHAYFTQKTGITPGKFRKNAKFDSKERSGGQQAT
ncbi:MAG TPA: XylR family transcriptional regulator [Candidatus Sulfotelmatobacter sp.]|jgi:LacI family transcriptional regulator|nr:XylR family transcriptional regulator [Candidatus Sulfotelmatobacter sp.]